MQELPGLVYSVSMTTRLPRAGEKEGREYFFVTHERFHDHIRKGDFLEWASVHGEFYGTLKSQVTEILNTGRNVVLDIDIQGAGSVKQHMPQAVSIFIMPPSLEELGVRLRQRGTETPEKMEARLQIAEKEIEAAQTYDYLVINSELDLAVQSVKNIILNT